MKSIVKTVIREGIDWRVQELDRLKKMYDSSKLEAERIKYALSNKLETISQYEKDIADLEEALQEMKTADEYANEFRNAITIKTDE